MINKIKKQFEHEFSALPSGVDAVEVNLSMADSFEVDVVAGEIESYDISHIQGLSLRADCGEIGSTYTESMEDEPKRLISLAAANASVVKNNDAQFMRFFEGSPSYEKIAPIDARLIKATPQQKIELAMEMEQKILNSHPLIQRNEHAIVSTATSETAIFNSLGLSVERQDGYVLAYVMPIAEKNGILKNGIGYYQARCLEEIDIDYMINQALEDVLSQFDAVSVPSGTYDIILNNRAMNSVLQAFTSMFSADAAQKGLSLLADKEGMQIGSKAVTLTDDPMNPHVLMQVPFDAEGVATYKKNIVENGVFKTLMHNRKTAAKAGVKTTGNASGSGSIGVGPSNFLLQSGSHSFEDLCKELNHGLCITNVSGLHAGTNAVTGDFSLLCRGYKIVNGQRAESVEQITIAGNFLELLKNIQVVGNDTYFPIITTPSVLIQGIQVAGE